MSQQNNHTEPSIPTLWVVWNSVDGAKAPVPIGTLTLTTLADIPPSLKIAGETYKKQKEENNE